MLITKYYINKFYQYYYYINNIHWKIRTFSEIAPLFVFLPFTVLLPYTPYHFHLGTLMKNTKSELAKYDLSHSTLQRRQNPKLVHAIQGHILGHIYRKMVKTISRIVLFIHQIVGVAFSISHCGVRWCG